LIQTLKKRSKEPKGNKNKAPTYKQYKEARIKTHPTKIKHAEQLPAATPNSQNHTIKANYIDHTILPAPKIDDSNTTSIIDQQNEVLLPSQKLAEGQTNSHRTPQTPWLLPS
jgi:hypothetical protein